MEFPSVLFFIDSPDGKMFSKNEMVVKGILIDVLSRATEELLVFVRDELKHMHELINGLNYTENKIRIKNYPMASFTKTPLFCETPGLDHQFDDCVILGQYIVGSKVQELAPFLKGPVNRQTLLLLGVKQCSSILKTLLRSKKPRKPQRVFTGSFFSSLVRAAWKFCKSCLVV